jgi:hypothetical protein
MKFLDNTLFLRYVDIIFLDIVSIIIDINCQIMRVMMRDTRRDVLD